MLIVKFSSSIFSCLSSRGPKMSLSIHTPFVLFGLQSRHAAFIVAHHYPSHGTFFSVCVCARARS